MACLCFSVEQRGPKSNGLGDVQIFASVEFYAALVRERTF